MFKAPLPVSKAPLPVRKAPAPPKKPSVANGEQDEDVSVILFGTAALIDHDNMHLIFQMADFKAPFKPPRPIDKKQIVPAHQHGTRSKSKASKKPTKDKQSKSKNSKSRSKK